MKSPCLSLVFLLSLFLAGPAFSEDPNAVPPIVAKGFEEFQRNGTLAAMNVWMAGSARETDAEQGQAVAKLNGVQGVFGRMVGYEIVRSVPLSPSTRRVYAAVKFEKGVAWISFDCYHTGADWIISRFDFATNANVVLPPSILGGQ